MSRAALLAGVFAATSAAASAQQLSVAGASLPPVTFAADAPASYAVDLGGDDVESAHVLLLPANASRTLARDRDGFWATWNGDPAALPPAAAVREGDRLTFKLFASAPIARLSPPYMITLAYRSGGVLKFGAFMASIAAPEADQ